MKKMILTAAIVLGFLSLKPASAQISLSLNIGSQPEWGPVGYDHVDYYYMPDIDSYYDISTHEYIYSDNNNQWVRRAYLPSRYANYDIYHGYKVVVNAQKPWTNGDFYRSKYASYKGRRDQVVIRDSRETKYRTHWVDRRAPQRKVVVRKDVHKDVHVDRHNDHDHDKGHGHRN